MCIRDRINAANIGEGKYAAAEEEARNAKRGIWQGPFERPKVFRLHNLRDDRTTGKDKKE